MHQNKYDVKACSDTVVVKVGIHRACTEAYCSKHQSVWLSSSQVGRGVPEQNREENGEWRGNLLNCGIFPTEAQDTRPSRAPGGSPEGQNCHEDAKTLRLRWLHIEQTFPRVEESGRKSSAAAKKKKSLGFVARQKWGGGPPELREIRGRASRLLARLLAAGIAW